MLRVMRGTLGPAMMAAIVTVHGAAAAASAAASPPPPWPPGSSNGLPVAADPVHPLLLGKLRIQLERTGLDEVRAALGTGTVVRQGDGSDALSYLCYTLPDPGPAQRLWLTSSELTGGRRIDGIVAVDLAAGSADAPSCPELPARFAPARFEDGLWLGAPSGEQKRAWAAALKANAPYSTTYHERQGDVDVLGSLAVDFRRGRIVGLYAAHATQN